MTPVVNMRQSQSNQEDLMGDPSESETAPQEVADIVAKEGSKEEPEKKQDISQGQK
jgi:hypothetical protein